MRYKDIEIYQYETTDQSNFKILNPDGTEYISINSNEIRNISINLKSGVVTLVGKILGGPKELELSKWKADKENLIKKLDFVIVKNGYAKHYILNAGIQKFREDYREMSYFVMFKHDNKDLPLYHTVDWINSDVRLDYKVDMREVGIKNVSTGTWVNLGVSIVGYGIGIAGVVSAGVITIPVTIALTVGAGYVSSSIFDFAIEYNNLPKEWLGNGDFVQQFVGWCGAILGEAASQDKEASEKKAENFYSKAVFVYGLVSGVKSAKILFNTKNFINVSKPFEEGYIKIKSVKVRSNTNALKFEGAQKTFNKELFINDMTNTVGAGKTVYDKVSSR